MIDNIKIGMTLPEGGVLLDWNFIDDEMCETIICLVVDPGESLPFVITVLHPFSEAHLFRHDHPERYGSHRDAFIMFEAAQEG